MAAIPPVPEFAVAVRDKQGALVIKVGDHVESYIMRTEAMTEGEFRVAILEMAHQIFGVFRSNEAFARRDVFFSPSHDRPARSPIHVKSGLLHLQAMSLAGAKVVWP